MWLVAVVGVVGGLSAETALRFGVPGAAADADAAVEDVGSRDGGLDLLFRSCDVAVGAPFEAAPVTAALLARVCVGVVRLIPDAVVVVVVVEPADVGRITTMELGLVADDSGGYLCVSFLAGGTVVVDVAPAASGGFFPSETERLGAGAADDALDEALPGLVAVRPLVARVGPVAVPADAELLVAAGRRAGFVGSRLGEMLRLGSCAPRSVSRCSLGGRAVGPAGLRSERARVSDDMAGLRAGLCQKRRLGGRCGCLKLASLDVVAVYYWSSSGLAPQGVTASPPLLDF